MADSVSVDTSQVEAMAKDMAKQVAKGIIGVRAVVAKGALNIKNDLRNQANASGIAEARALGRFINYDTKMRPGSVTAEIGPEEQEKGSAGHGGSFAFLYFGNSKNGPVLPDPGDALMREVPNLEKYILAVLNGKP